MILLESQLGSVPRYSRGKVRDVYAADDRLLIVATDRLSAFDCVLPTGIPDKGRVLTQISIFWFDFLRDLVPTHFLTADVNQYPAALAPFREQLDGRSMLVKRARMIEVECVARGYLAGSGWKEYRERGSVCGIRLPAGLKESDQLPEPIFTPATKAQSGHDENVSFEHVSSSIGSGLAAKLARFDAGNLPARRRATPRRGALSLPTPSSNSDSWATNWCLGDEVAHAGFLALLAGRHLPSRRTAILLR